MFNALRRSLFGRVTCWEDAVCGPKFSRLLGLPLTTTRLYCSAGFESIMACLPYYAKGEVIKGFGRGSKDLGIPTANLPENVVSGLPKALETGIYHGLSNVDGGTVYKTVLSIGWNPFYHNIKKSLEAHLIHGFQDDFYGSELRLVILGYIRPERNYPSLELLIEAINNDIEIAKNELDKDEFIRFQNDSFFKNSDDIKDSLQNVHCYENEAFPATFVPRFHKLFGGTLVTTEFFTTGQAATKRFTVPLRRVLMPEPPAKKPRNMPESTVEETNGCGSEVHEENGHGHSNGDSRAMKNGGKIPKRMETCTHEQEPNDNSVLLCKRLSDDAYLPTRGSRSAAGFDLYSAKDIMIEAKNKGLVQTQLAITVPFGSYGRIAPRSGLACKKFIDVGAGVIDHDYTGEVKVLLFNFSDEDFEVKKGDRIAQLVIEKIFMPELREVEDLQKTERGGTGFGASGK